ncbi:hypothetical protein VHA_002513 [Grimontia hollisae CIP 101886]|uniref:Uncharacterized protein n=1 Tax=Grimontia hollisae CIP 101886 TaxID=675812 RepID=D0I9H6_GRIHO|nr:hypothetical protein VHA_002513 [Grimontia hollisae CIP 101886]
MDYVKGKNSLRMGCAISADRVEGSFFYMCVNRLPFYT